MDVQDKQSDIRCFPWKKNWALGVKREVGVSEPGVTSKDVEAVEA